jgi:hypothetical protein
MGAFSFARTASGIPDLFLGYSRDARPSSGREAASKNVSNTAYLSSFPQKISTAVRVDNWHYVYQT